METKGEGGTMRMDYPGKMNLKQRKMAVYDR